MAKKEAFSPHLGEFLFSIYCSSKYLHLPKLQGSLINLFFFSVWVFFREHSRITGPQGKGEGISLTPHYHFHPRHRHLDISRAITEEGSPLHIVSSRT